MKQLGFWLNSWKWRSLLLFSSKGFTLLVSFSLNPSLSLSLSLCLVAYKIYTHQNRRKRKKRRSAFLILCYLYIPTWWIGWWRICGWKVHLRGGGIWIWWFRGLATLSLEIIYILLSLVFFLLSKRLVLDLVINNI